MIHWVVYGGRQQILSKYISVVFWMWFDSFWTITVKDEFNNFFVKSVDFCVFFCSKMYRLIDEIEIQLGFELLSFEA